MRHAVMIQQQYKTGDFIVNPEGTFKGYGLYAGIYPYRALQSPTNEAFGELIIELLALSGPTGYHIRDHTIYDREHEDAESRRVLDAYRPKKPNTSTLARQFAHGAVQFNSGQKSWLVTSYCYDSKLRCLQAYETLRVKMKEGTGALGEAVPYMLKRAPRHGK